MLECFKWQLLFIIFVRACVHAPVRAFVEGGFLDISTAGVRLKKRLHSFHIQAESEKHTIHI